MFGTFLNVDYRNSSAKMVCFYGGKPSEQLDLKNNVDYRYRNDAFDLRRASDNPLLENQIGKKDWDKSNKVVGFNVDIGPQNQSIFQGFNVSQNPGKSTAESLEVLNQMANQAGNRGGSTQSLSLYNVYKNRSYSCTITMMGNAIIQPTMYFNLRNVPMFSGPYMITSVNHTINPGHFETVIEGIRQPTASLPKVENYLQSLKTTLLKTIVDKVAQEKVEKEKLTSSATTTNVKSENAKKVKDLTKKGGTTSDSTPTCEPNVKYGKYISETPLTTKANYKDVISLINSKTTDQKIRYSVFVKMYLQSSNGDKFATKENNFSGVEINSNWGEAGEKYFVPKFYCDSKDSTDGKIQTPYVFFDSVDAHVDFLIARYKGRVGQINSITVKDVTKFMILYSDNGIPKNEDVYTSMNPTDLSNIENKVQDAIDIYNPVIGNVTGVNPPADVPAPKPFDFVVENVGGSFNKLTVTIKPNNGLWEMFVAEFKFFKTTSECSGESSGSGRRLDEYLSLDKQIFTITKQNILNDEDCGPNTPQQDLIGKYTYTVWIYANPILPDGKLDNSRQQSIFSHKFSFEIK